MIRVSGFVFIVVWTVAVSCLSAFAEEPAKFYVAVDGDDAAPGDLEHPFATLERARDAVREALKSNSQANDIVVMLRGGTYYLDETVRFTPEDSGRDGHRVIYTNYPGEMPVLVGGRRVTGWEEAGDGVYRTHLDADWQFDQLFENGVRQTKARYPDEGYLIAESAPKDSRTQFVFAKGDVPNWDNLSGGQVYIWAGADWFSNLLPIQSIDYATRTITLTRPTLQEIGRRNQRRYFIQGIKAALNRPGEFWRDPDTGDLLYIPVTTPIEDQVIVAPTVTRIVSLEGVSSESPVRNIVFRGIHFDVSKFTDAFMEIDGTHGQTPWNEPANKEAAVYLEHTDGCAVENCRITNAGYSGVAVVWSGQHNRITGNEIAACGFHGVLLSGYRSSFGRDMDLNKFNEVSNNWIHHCGRLVGHGAGVFLWASGHNAIEHNRIHDMPRYGICMKGERWGTGYTDAMAARGLTKETHYDFLYSRENRFAYNHIFNVSLDTEDNGFISFWGTGKGNVVDHNLLHGCPRTLGGLGIGIYLDDAADYFTVSNNVIYDIVAGDRLILIFAKGVHNVIENNVLVCSPRTESGIRSFEMANEAVAHHTYRHNVMYLDGDAVFYYFQNWADDRVDESDYNLFYHSEGKYRVKGAPGGEDWDSWRAIFNGKFDAHSKRADPSLLRRKHRISD